MIKTVNSRLLTKKTGGRSAMKQKKKAKQKRKRLAWKDAFKKQLDNLKNRRPQEYPYPQSKKSIA